MSSRDEVLGGGAVVLRFPVPLSVTLPQTWFSTLPCLRSILEQ